MCGIFGAAGKVLPEEKVRLAADALAHRGPDGEGFYFTDGAQLAHRRLSIIDPAGGAQPMANEDSTLHIAFNGCVYNYLELRQSLLHLGHKFKTYTDTEVIIHAYEQYGEDCLSHFTGMFSFAIWDAKNGTLFAARDRFGVKPFYYAFDGETVVFASEIKALLVAGAARAELDNDALGDYITFQCCLGDKTLFRGVKKLEPGCSMTFRPGGSPVIRKYWDLSFDLDNYHTEEYFVDQLRLLLMDAVKIRLRADVPVGAHLSGGLDSTTVVCLMSELMSEGKLQTFTGGFNLGPEFDETGYAKIVSDFSSTEHYSTYLGPEDFSASIRKIIYHMDEPAAGPGVFPQYFVSKLASEKVKVVNGGQGGDEIFLGYARYLLSYLEECMKGAIWETHTRAQFVATLETMIPNLFMLKQYQPLMQYFWRDGLFADADRRYFRLMDRSEGSLGMFSKDVRYEREERFAEFQTIFNRPKAESLINKMSYFDLKVHLPALLQVEDRTSMAWSLESRVPLLDHRIAELIMSIPPTMKFAGGKPKSILKKAVSNMIPPEVLNRKDKMGFPVPLSQWFKGELKDFVGDILLGEKCRNRGLFDADVLRKAVDGESKFSRVIWGALCLELWHQVFVDQGGGFKPE